LQGRFQAGGKNHSSMAKTAALSAILTCSSLCWWVLAAGNGLPSSADWTVAPRTATAGGEDTTASLSFHHGAVVNGCLQASKTTQCAGSYFTYFQ
jgi:hypothetical protein